MNISNLMRTQSSSETLMNNIKTIRENISTIFAMDSDNYRQKLVYSLLNIVRSGDMQQFLWVLLRHLNTRKEPERLEQVIRAINELSGYGSGFFQKWAYSVIMGIMEAKSSKEEGK